MKRKTTKGAAKRLAKIPAPPAHPHPGNTVAPTPTVDQANIAVDVLRTDRAAQELRMQADAVLHRFLRANLNEKKGSAWSPPVYTVGGAFTGNTFTGT